GRDDWTPAGATAAMGGRETREMSPRPKTSPGEAVLSVSDWKVEGPGRPGRLVVDGVSLEARRGEVLGIAGLVGSGRTALVTSLFGLARSRVSGRLTMQGRAGDSPFRRPSEAIAAGIALVGEDRKREGLVAEASVLGNLTLPARSRYPR